MGKPSLRTKIGTIGFGSHYISCTDTTLSASQRIGSIEFKTNLTISLSCSTRMKCTSFSDFYVESSWGEQHPHNLVGDKPCKKTWLQNMAVYSQLYSIKYYKKCVLTFLCMLLKRKEKTVQFGIGKFIISHKSFQTCFPLQIQWCLDDLSSTCN